MTTKNCNERRPIAEQRWSAVILTDALAACSTAESFFSNPLGCRHRRLDLFALVDRTDVGVWHQNDTADVVESLEDWNLSATCPRMGVRFQPTDYVLTSGMGLNTHQAQALSYPRGTMCFLCVISLS